MPSERSSTRSPTATFLLLLVLALALLPYGAQRFGLDAGARFADRSPLVWLFTLGMAALLLSAYVLARRRRIIF